MRRVILALIMVAIVVAASEPAGAIDNRFRGRYQILAREAPGATCRSNSHSGSGRALSAGRVDVRYVSERVRDFYHPRVERATRFTYVPGERFPWQGELAHRAAELRYRRRTDSAVGTRDGLEGCSWRVRLVPIG